MASVHLLNNKFVTVAGDRYLSINSEIILAFNRIQYLWRKRANTIGTFKKITEIKWFRSMTKDFLQDHINGLIIDKKIKSKINMNKNSYKVKRGIVGWSRSKFYGFCKWFFTDTNINSRYWKSTLDWFHYVEYFQKTQTNQ